jgi:hypothetical protein
LNCVCTDGKQDTVKATLPRCSPVIAPASAVAAGTPLTPTIGKVISKILTKVADEAVNFMAQASASNTDILRPAAFAAPAA